MSHSKFVHLHVHSQYSLLEGACKLKELAERAVQLKFPAIAITDNGNLFGAIDFYKICRITGVKPIIGMDAFIAPASRFDRTARGMRDAAQRLVLLAKDEEGYRNLIKLSSFGYTEGFYYKPRIDKDLLNRYKKGLIVLSGGLTSEIALAIRNQDEEQARLVIEQYRDMMGENNFYLEIFDHQLDVEKDLIQELVRLGSELGVPLVATNNVQYLMPADHEAHDALMCIGTGNQVSDTNRLRYTTNEFYLKSAEEMESLFAHLPEALANTIRIADACNLVMDFSKTHLPKFTPPDQEDPTEYLKRLCREGLEKIKGKLTPQYQERLDYELGVIIRMKYVSYFLIVADFCMHARAQGIPVGPGRGSAAGSLVAYALSITNLDPIEHGLIFERFLNPERVSMPDIDIDFCYERRDQVIDYVRNKYGHDNVAQIITFGTMMARAVIRDVGRVLGIPYQDVDRIAKLVPTELKMTLAKALQVEPRLGEEAKADEKIQKLLDISKVLEGLTRHASTHAAGVVISDKPLIEHCPLFKAGDQFTTQYSMKILEDIGLLKMDFLGLKTLTVLDHACRFIKERQDVTIDLDRLQLKDEMTYDLLSQGDTFGVFQLESSGMRDIIRKMKPRLFGDIVALLALYRPGPLGSGMVDDFIKCKLDPTKIVYDHPDLEGILRETYGVILYQEQVMKIVSTLAGFSLAQADSLRRAIGKKIQEVMEKEKQAFLDGATERKVPIKAAEKIWKLIDYFSGYGFNKSHSAAYALISYQTAYLKANYPVEFMTALLTSEKDNTDKIVLYIEEARRLGIEVLGPSVNQSRAAFTCLKVDENDPTSKGQIRFGLTAIKNVGQSAVEAIVTARNEGGLFKDYFDFFARVDQRTCNRKVIESLIKAGGMDIFKLPRSVMLAMLEEAVDLGTRAQRDRQSGQLSLLDELEGEDGEFTSVTVPKIEEWPESQLLAYEKELLGFYLSSHPLSSFGRILKAYAQATTSTLSEFEDQADVTLGGLVSSLREITTKKGDRMAFVRVEDLEGTCEIVVFPEIYKKAYELLHSDTPVYIRGKISLREDVASILANEITKLSDVSQQATKSIAIDLRTTGLDPTCLEDLKKVIEQNRGSTPVFLAFRNPAGERVLMSAGQTFWVQTSEKLFEQIEALFGENSIKIATNPVAPPPERSRNQKFYQKQS